jgi:hypothetical protein
MCKLVSLSKVMEIIASELQQLLRAMGKLLSAVAVRLKTVIQKAKSMMNIASVDDVLDAAADFVSDAK